MTSKIHLVADKLRLEEKMIIKELSTWSELKIVNPENNFFQFNDEISADLALIRSISLYTSIYMAAVYESSSIHTVNTSDTIIQAGDKVLSYSKLSREGLPIPKTIYLPPIGSLKSNGITYPVVTKPPIGSWGRMVSIHKDPVSLETILELRKSMPCYSQKHILIQQYVESGGSDIRCIVIGGDFLGCMKRKSVKGEWRSNVALGGSPTSFKADDSLIDLSLKVGEVFKAFFISIDFLSSESIYYVNEVNGVPEFKGFYSATGLNPALVLSDKIRDFLRK